MDIARRVTNGVKKIQIDAQLFLCIFRQLLHVSGVSKPIIRRYKHLYTTIGTYYSFWMTVCYPGWIRFGRIYSPSSGGTNVCI